MLQAYSTINRLGPCARSRVRARTSCDARHIPYTTRTHRMSLHTRQDRLTTRPPCTPAHPREATYNSTGIEDRHGKRHAKSLLMRYTEHPHSFRASRARPRQCRRGRRAVCSPSVQPARSEKLRGVAVAERGSRLQTAHPAPAAPPERAQRALDEVFTV